MVLEQKAWEVDPASRNEYKKLEELMLKCNQSLRRLKLGNEFHNQLNDQGSSPAEVLGIDYKATLKPMLASFEDDMKKNSMGKLEEISLQQQTAEKVSKVESKKKHLTALPGSH